MKRVKKERRLAGPSARIKKHQSFLLFYRDCNPTQRKKLLDIAQKEQILSLCETSKNAMCGVLPLKEGCKKRLGKKKKAFRALSFEKLGWKRKRDIAKSPQVGGILGELVATAAGFLFDKLFNSHRSTSKEEEDPGQPPVT